MTTTSYSISAAHRITGKSRTTISKHIKTGKLSATKDADGRPTVEASELMRVYGDACDFSREEGTGTIEKSTDSRRIQHTVQSDQSGLHTLQTQLEKEIAERERERQHFREQIEQLQQALERSQEGHNRATLLLEQRASGGGELQEAVKRLQTQLTTLEVDAKQQAKQELLSRPWWRLLGA